MLLSAVSVLVVAQSSSEIPEGLMNNPVIELGRVAGSESIWVRIATILYGKAELATDTSLLVFGSFLGGLWNEYSTWAA